jgi:hypothetical protein
MAVARWLWQGARDPEVQRSAIPGAAPLRRERIRPAVSSGGRRGFSLPAPVKQRLTCPCRQCASHPMAINMISDAMDFIRLG